MLNKQLQAQIEQEAISLTSDRSGYDFHSGYNQGIEKGYMTCAEKYVSLWQEAEQRADRYEKALREIKKGLNWIENSRELDIMHDAITPKTTNDE